MFVFLHIKKRIKNIKNSRYFLFLKIYLLLDGEKNNTFDRNLRDHK
jgi:hypothetical protein